MEKTLLIFFLIIFLAEGLSIYFGKIISFYLIPVFGLFFLGKLFLEKRKILFPKKITVTYLLFLIFSAISTIQSNNFEASTCGFLIYLFMLPVLIISYNLSSQISKLLPELILILGIIFSVFSLILPSIINNSHYLISFSGYQFIYSAFGSHNHLGDFLVLAIITAYYFLIKEDKKKYILYIFFFLFFLIFSYSRTAYLSLGITLSVMTTYFLKNKNIHFNSGYLIIPITVILLLFLLFFSVVKEVSSIPILSSINQNLTQNNNLTPKYLGGNRLFYFKESFLIFQKNPFFGVGPNNLRINYRQNLYKTNVTDTSHNLFLDILSQRGIFVFLSFAVIIFTVCYLSFKKVTLNTFLFLSLLIMFQTDYLHLFYSVIFLFTILSGTILKNEQTKST